MQDLIRPGWVLMYIARAILFKVFQPVSSSLGVKLGTVELSYLAQAEDFQKRIALAKYIKTQPGRIKSCISSRCYFFDSLMSNVTGLASTVTVKPDLLMSLYFAGTSFHSLGALAAFPFGGPE